VSTPSQARLRAFVRQHTHLRPVADLPAIRLHTGSDVMELCKLTGELLGQPDPDLPYWAFPWAGGLAVAHHVADRPEIVAGRAVLDLASGSGLCGIAASRAGAQSVIAADIDPLAGAAAWLNARANATRLDVIGQDLLDDPPPAVDVILAGDVCYQEGMASRVLPWLRRAARNGTLVLIGDPGRAYLPAGLERLASYRVRSSRELEPAEVTAAAVYTFAASRR
jgi:predicted nicotinamide N-methyase